MSGRPTYFLGGCRHGEWLTLDDRMHDVVMPRVDPPSLDDPFPDWDRVTLSTHHYRVQRVALTVEHPCVPHAAFARLYSVAVWDRMTPGVMPPVFELLDRGVIESEHRGRLDSGHAPDWWLVPPRGLFAGFRVMIG